MSDQRGRPSRSDHPETGTKITTGRAAPAMRESLQPRASGRVAPVRHPSHKIAASVYCEIDGLQVEIEPLELSTAGLFVETPTPLPPDSEVEVFVRIGDARFTAFGHVVQTISVEQAKQKSRKPGYGLLFTNIDDEARAQLRRGIQLLVSHRAGPKSPAPKAAAPQPTRSLRAGPLAADGGGPKPSHPPTTRSLRAGPLAADGGGAKASPAPVKPAKLTKPSAKPPPPVAVIVPADPRELEVLDKLQTELRALDAKTPWATLGVSQGASAVEAKRAFFDASKRYHPHLFARYALPAIKPVVTELFIAHKRAYTTMLKSGKPMRVSVVEHAAVKAIASKQPEPGNK